VADVKYFILVDQVSKKNQRNSRFAPGGQICQNGIAAMATGSDADKGVTFYLVCVQKSASVLCRLFLHSIIGYFRYRYYRILSLRAPVFWPSAMRHTFRKGVPVDRQHFMCFGGSDTHAIFIARCEMVISGFYIKLMTTTVAVH